MKVTGDVMGVSGNVWGWVTRNIGLEGAWGDANKGKMIG